MPHKKQRDLKHSQGAGSMSKVIPPSENPTNGSPSKPATLMMI